VKALTITTKLLIEQHIHGAFGVDFNKAEEDEIRFVSEKLLEHGIGGYFPTLVTDSVENIKRQISVIKEAALSDKGAKILGIHLEGIFINPAKKGIHNPNHFLPAAIKDYKLFEDDFIKIVTMAPEFDKGLLPYLRSKGVKVQAGHCVTGDLSNVDGVTHLFNAMTGISHRGESTALSALNNDEIYTELIADGVHLSDEILKLTFKCKPSDKVILISDALPITYSDRRETIFADAQEKTFAPVIEEDKKEFIQECVCPIITNGDIVGAIMIMRKEDKPEMTQTEMKMAQCASEFIGRHLEE
jgi:N-acetylglucosamine-6-phosphate deacetylase